MTKEYKFKHPKLWIEAIDKLIEHYRECNRISRLIDTCPLCTVEKREPYATGPPDCFCPWYAFRKRGRNKCASGPKSRKPASNIRRLKDWRKRFEAMIEEGK